MIMPGHYGLGAGGIFCDQILSQKVKVSQGIDLNTWKYNVRGIKLATKVMSSHKIQVEKIL